MRTWFQSRVTLGKRPVCAETFHICLWIYFVHHCGSYLTGLKIGLETACRDFKMFRMLQFIPCKFRYFEFDTMLMAETLFLDYLRLRLLTSTLAHFKTFSIYVQQHADNINAIIATRSQLNKISATLCVPICNSKNTERSNDKTQFRLSIIKLNN